MLQHKIRTQQKKKCTAHLGAPARVMNFDLQVILSDRGKDVWLLTPGEMAVVTKMRHATEYIHEALRPPTCLAELIRVKSIVHTTDLANIINLGIYVAMNISHIKAVFHTSSDVENTGPVQNRLTYRAEIFLAYIAK